MEKIEQTRSTVCFAKGPSQQNWNESDNYCWTTFGASTCSLRQLRLAICRNNGTPGPVPFWTGDSVASTQISGLFAVMASCSGSGVRPEDAGKEAMPACCLEYMKY